ncbi:MAG TPA: ClpX C4-type zinc finger protein [Bryobacteraceae bacterium]
MGRGEGLKRSGSKDLPRCSFCHKNQSQVGKLISSIPGKLPRVYICDQCVLMLH